MDRRSVGRLQCSALETFQKALWSVQVAGFRLKGKNALPATQCTDLQRNSLTKPFKDTLVKLGYGFNYPTTSASVSISTMVETYFSTTFPSAQAYFPSTRGRSICWQDNQCYRITIVFTNFFVILGIPGTPELRWFSWWKIEAPNKWNFTLSKTGFQQLLQKANPDHDLFISIVLFLLYDQIWSSFEELFIKKLFVLQQ